MNKKIKVLLVDDEDRFLKTTTKILGHRGIESLSATNGPEALDKLGEQPDVVVLDIRMPGMDGEATLAAIKARDLHLPVIMLTGHGEQASAERAVAMGACDYLTKPVDLDLLVCKIEEAARSRELAGHQREKRVAAAMRPLAACTLLVPESPVAAIMQRWRKTGGGADGPQTGFDGPAHVLVGKDQEIVGLVTARELLGAIRPRYLADQQLRSQSAGSTWRYSNMFWSGLFAQQLEEILAQPVAGIMTLPPPPIAGDATLMEACDLLQETRVSCLLVMEGAVVVGLLEESALVAEMAWMVAERATA